MQKGTNGAAVDRLQEAQRQWELWRLWPKRETGTPSLSPPGNGHSQLPESL